jgi:hypothetical protein
MANLGIAYVTGGVREQRSGLGEKRTGLEFAMAGESTDGDVIAGIADVTEVIETADVDEHRRRRESEFHEGQQRMSAGEEFGLVTVFGEEGDGLVGRSGPLVIERRRNHFVAPDCSAAQARTDFTML